MTNRHTRYDAGQLATLRDFAERSVDVLRARLDAEKQFRGRVDPACHSSTRR
jgi:hypothetical protein